MLRCRQSLCNAEAAGSSTQALEEAARKQDGELNVGINAGAVSLGRSAVQTMWRLNAYGMFYASKGYLKKKQIN